MITSIQNTVQSPAATFPDDREVNPPPVLPAPQSTSADGDPMGMLYLLLSKQRANDMNSAQANVKQNRAIEKADQLEQENALIKQEKDAQNAAAWGIFGKIASLVAIAVSAVAAACSCGAASALCVGACVLSAAAFAEGETHVLTTLTGNPDVDKAFQIGCGIGAALCSGGAGIATLGSSVLVGTSEVLSAGCKVGQEVMGNIDDKGCQDVAMGFGIGGAVSGVVGSFGTVGNLAQSGGDALKNAVKAGADVANGVTQVAAGATTIVSSQYTADATDRAADAKQAQQAINRLQTLTKWVIDAVKETDDSHAHALQTLAGAMQTQAQTLVIASSKV
jgi:hypothetical protein